VIILKNTKKTTSLRHAFDAYIGEKPLLKEEDTCCFLRWLQGPKRQRRLHVLPVILTVLFIISIGTVGVVVVNNGFGKMQAPPRELDPKVISEAKEKPPFSVEIQEEEMPTLEELLQDNPKYEAVYEELVAGFNKIAHYRELKYEYAEVTMYYLHAVWTGNKELIKQYITPFSSEYREQLWFDKNIPFYEEVSGFDVNVAYVLPSLGEPVISILLEYRSHDDVRTREMILDLQNPESDQYLTLWDRSEGNSIEEPMIHLLRWNASIGLSTSEARELFGEPTLIGNREGNEVWLYDEIITQENYVPSVDTIAVDAIKNKEVRYQLFFTFEGDRVIAYALYTRTKDGQVWEFIRNSDLDFTEGLFES
jgi:hypothetical protein